MKKELLIFLLLLNSFFLFGQSNPHKPAYVIIANDTIVTLAKVAKSSFRCRHGAAQRYCPV